MEGVCATCCHVRAVILQRPDDVEDGLAYTREFRVFSPAGRASQRVLDVDPLQYTLATKYNVLAAFSL